MRLPAHGRPLCRLARAAAGSLAMVLLATSASIAPPLFEVKPDPPQAGSDVNVVYFGNNETKVTFEVGDGEVHSAKVGKDGSFTIPKKFLKVGKKLRIRDAALPDLPNAAVCFVIEPGA